MDVTVSTCRICRHPENTPGWKSTQETGDFGWTNIFHIGNLPLSITLSYQGLQQMVWLSSFGTLKLHCKWHSKDLCSAFIMADQKRLPPKVTFWLKKKKECLAHSWWRTDSAKKPTFTTRKLNNSKHFHPNLGEALRGPWSAGSGSCLSPVLVLRSLSCLVCQV